MADCPGWVRNFCFCCWRCTCLPFTRCFHGRLPDYRYRAGSLCFWLAPALWVSTEYLRAQVLTGFPWCLLGYGLVDAVNLAQIARWTGVYGLSFAAISVSAFVAEVLVRPSRSAVLRLGSIASVLLCLTLGFGSIGKGYLSRRIWFASFKPTSTWIKNWMLLQGPRCWTSSHSSQFHRNRGESTPIGIRSGSFFGPRRQRRSILTTTATFGVAWRTLRLRLEPTFYSGFVDFRPHSKGGSERDPYNSVAMLSPDGRVISQYDKIHLVPFGEYIPYEKLFFFVDKISTEAGNFKAWRPRCGRPARQPGFGGRVRLLRSSCSRPCTGGSRGTEANSLSTSPTMPGSASRPRLFSIWPWPGCAPSRIIAIY